MLAGKEKRHVKIRQFQSYEEDRDRQCGRWWWRGWQFCWMAKVNFSKKWSLNWDLNGEKKVAGEDLREELWKRRRTKSLGHNEAGPPRSSRKPVWLKTSRQQVKDLETRLGKEGPPRRPHWRAYIFILRALENHWRVLSREMISPDLPFSKSLWLPRGCGGTKNGEGATS